LYFYFDLSIVEHPLLIILQQRNVQNLVINNGQFPIWFCLLSKDKGRILCDCL